MSNRYPTDILKKLQTAISVWESIDPNLKIGNLSLNELRSALDRGKELKSKIDALEIELTDLRNKRDETFGAGWGYITRMRSGIKAIYGDDSSEYEMAGGTRRSERKPRSKRSKASPS
jgi:hypothetical protein